MTKNTKTVIILLVLAVFIAVIPLVAPERRGIRRLG